MEKTPPALIRMLSSTDTLYIHFLLFIYIKAWIILEKCYIKQKTTLGV